MSFPHQRIPVLDLCVDRSIGNDQSGDWPKGEFHAHSMNDKMVSTDEVFRCEVEMKMSGARGIQEMLTASPPTAFFCLEVRCSQTGWSQVEILDTRTLDADVADEADGSTMGVMTFEVEKQTVTETFYLWPSVVTLKDSRMSCEGMHDVIREMLMEHGHNTVEVPANYQLAIGRPLVMRPERGHAPFYFTPSNELKEGEMILRFSSEGGDGVFQVQHNIDERRITSDKNLWWAVYASVLGLLPSTNGATLERNARDIPEVPESPTLTSLAVRLHNAGIPLWDEGDKWDPLQVLTAVKNLEGEDRQPLFPLPAVPDYDE